MSETILVKDFKVAGVLADMTSVTIEVTWTGGTLIAAGTAMDHDPLVPGVYSATWTDPAPGLTYTYAIEFVYGGITYPLVGTVAAATVYDPATVAFVEHHCSIRVVPSIEQDFAYSRLPQFLAWGPLEAAPTITEMRSGEVLVENVDFIWRPNGEIIELGAVRRGVWQIDYVAGYSTVPPGLDTLMATLAPLIAQSGGFQSETLGDYSYTIAQQASGDTASALSALDLYRRVMV